MNPLEILEALGFDPSKPLLGGHDGEAALGSGPVVPVRSPATGRPLASVRQIRPREIDRIVRASQSAFLRWREVPAPARGSLVRAIGEELRRHKRLLGRLVSAEAGKILSEGDGEVQEMIDMADFAVGLSRQLYGHSMHSERPRHRLYEQWHPLGPIAVITAFNFPVAVWAWNALLAAVCGDTVVWKPSEKTPLTAIATHAIASKIANGFGLAGLFTLAIGDAACGEALAANRRIPLVSATGSCRMGRAVSQTVARRLGRTLLELGGNNAAIVLDDADLDLAIRAIVFGAAGTAGQRCTSLRRLFLQAGIAKRLSKRLTRAYRQVALRIGDPLDPRTLVGPLVDGAAAKSFTLAVARARAQGGRVLFGGRRVPSSRLPRELRGGFFVEPTLIQAPPELPIAQEETFAPILYLFTVDSLDEAIARQNDAAQGLASAIFTRSLAATEEFLSARGSDCGIANVNIGTSGAEIGGAFGGEKETGGGREAGSDAWKAYMRRQTCTINFSKELPLAQGVKFEV